MAYNNSSGGTLALPSPTHVHHVDVTAAVRTLRRSMSRSPSKFNLAATASKTPVAPTAPARIGGVTHSLVSSASPSPGPDEQTTTPPSPSRYRSNNDNSHSTPSVYANNSFFLAQTPSATPSRSGVKLSVRSVRPKSISRPLPRTRVSPKSPLKRVFSPSLDSINVIPTSISGPEASGQENTTCFDFAPDSSPASHHTMEKSSRHSMHLDVSGSSKHNISRFLEVNTPLPTASVSPMKRSDATMGPDQTSLGSPVAKRRSLHGISSIPTTSDLNVFDSPSPPAPQQNSFDIHEDNTNSEYRLSASPPVASQEPPPSTTPAAVPKRTTSLRKTSLHQRYGDGRTSWGRRAGEKQLAQLSSDMGTPIARNRPRLSVDQYVQPEERGSLFAATAPLPNPLAHSMLRASHQPHPLSRTLTQSSSNSSIPDESPTHTPLHTEKPRGPPIFAKSLPVGALRPKDDGMSIATPQYKNAKPFQAAFMSTGLVSKINRSIGPMKAGEKGAAAMPDTPCKKQSYPANTYPPHSGSGRKKSRPSFGSPGTPFRSSTRPFASSLGNLERSAGLFKHVQSGHSRSDSIWSFDGDEQGDLHDDFPPTPTKNLFVKPVVDAPTKVKSTPVAPRLFGTPATVVGVSNELQTRDANSESRPLECFSTGAKKTVDSQFVYGSKWSPASNLAGMSSSSFCARALGRSAASHELFNTPSQLRIAPQTPFTNASEKGIAKMETPALVSFFDVGHAEKSTPQTPREEESMMPPDPSRLSISHNNNDKTLFGSTDKVIQPPATPTTHGRDVFPSFAARRLSTTPQNHQGPADVDESLNARFEKAEVIGSGEFSQVYRVVKSTVRTSLATQFATASERRLSDSASAEVFAVKKIKLPVFNTKERAAKMREVTALKALVGSDKIVHYVDSWEQNYHLYIQTEFCEEGSLETFLNSVGNVSRLDDFRIWKIMLEVAQGLSAIHDAGFIHLDLKPANVLISFDGYLKIGDFGMAAAWPAEKGLEGEGDREYMAPEILSGRFDKPADIFALGLIALEAALNVFLPDFGPTWQKFRSGDLSGLGNLTWPEASAVERDANGIPVEHDSGFSLTDDDDVPEGLRSLSHGEFTFGADDNSMTHDPSNLFGVQKDDDDDLSSPPNFMVDIDDANSLDNIVKWLMSPNPDDRPTAQRLLDTDAIRWVAAHRLAGATVYEGNWGPQTSPPAEEAFDTEMTDV